MFFIPFASVASFVPIFFHLLRQNFPPTFLPPCLLSLSFLPIFFSSSSITYNATNAAFNAAAATAATTITTNHHHLHHHRHWHHHYFLRLLWLFCRIKWGFTALLLFCFRQLIFYYFFFDMLYSGIKRQVQANLVPTLYPPFPFVVLSWGYSIQKPNIINKLFQLKKNWQTP